MFGFSRPLTASDEYRSYYSRLCQHQRALNGNFSAIFHSYEAVMLFALAGDAGLFNTRCLPKKRCCGMQPLARRGEQADSMIAEYCCRSGMLLAKVKFEDDIRDNGSRKRLRGRILTAVFRRSFLQMQRYFDEFAPNLLPSISMQIDRHHQMEVDGCDVRLEEFIEPTAKCFSLLFAGLPDLSNRYEFTGTFATLGYHLGAALLANDCSADWQMDLLRRDANPVRDNVSATDALKVAIHHLRQFQSCAAANFGEVSLTAAVADSIRQRLERRLHPQQLECSSKEHSKRMVAVFQARVRALWDYVRGVEGHWTQMSRSPTFYCADPGSLGGLCAVNCCCSVGESACAGALGACCEQEKCCEDKNGNGCASGCCDDCEKDCS